ncbi:MAG: hypothetical protein R3A13_04575 [Bdellovibrionota bacterium]
MIENIRERDGAEAPLLIEGLTAEQNILLYSPDSRDRGRVVIASGQSLLDTIDHILRTGVVVDPDLKAAVEQFQRVMEIDIERQTNQVVSCVEPYSTLEAKQKLLGPLIRRSEAVISWLSELSELVNAEKVENVKTAEFRDYCDAGLDACHLFSDVSTIVPFKVLESGLILPLSLNHQFLDQSSELLRGFSCERRLDSFVRRAPRIKKLLQFLHERALSFIALHEIDSTPNQSQELTRLLPFSLSAIQGLGLIEKLPIPFKPRDRNVLQRIVREVAERFVPALQAAA